MRDPVTGFIYPKDWVTKVTDYQSLELVKSGFAVLTASGTVLRRGFTTGTTAAAACKAAILSLSDDVSQVTVKLPCGLVADLPVTACAGSASCRKYAGDYPSDVTAGIEFVAEAVISENSLSLVPGTGIGRFVRNTPRYRKEAPAISEIPLACILSSMQEALGKTGLNGAIVTLSITDGERIGEKTLNPRIGIEGGISVLGSTGLVEPWDDHLEESVLCRIAAATHVVITTGRIGLRYARLLFPDSEVVLAGGKIGEALSVAKGDIILCGLPALILKYLEPHILDGTGCETMEELAASGIFRKVVDPVLETYRKKHPQIRVVLISRDGKIIAESP